jgi:hypothetical protein
MSLNDLAPFTFVFTPTLKTREKIQVTVFFVVGGRALGHFLAMFASPRDVEPAQEEIRQAVFAEASAIVNRWALRFPSADAAVDLSSYSSLAHALADMTSPEFVIRRLIVREITALTEQLPIPPGPAPDVSIQARCQRELTDLDETEFTFEQFSHWEVNSRTRSPELWADEFHAGLMKRKLEKKKSDILFSKSRL